MFLTTDYLDRVLNDNHDGHPEPVDALSIAVAAVYSMMVNLPVGGFDREIEIEWRIDEDRWGVHTWYRARTTVWQRTGHAEQPRLALR